eukprot:3952394-Prymnesium_polylepis.1
MLKPKAPEKLMKKYGSLYGCTVRSSTRPKIVPRSSRRWASSAMRSRFRPSSSTCTSCACS